MTNNLPVPQFIPAGPNLTLHYYMSNVTDAPASPCPQVDQFILTGPNIGDPERVKIRSSNTGLGAAWHFEYIDIISSATNQVRAAGQGRRMTAQCTCVVCVYARVCGGYARGCVCTCVGVHGMHMPVCGGYALEPPHTPS